MNALIEPNIHPILVHFAYALSITALVCYLLSELKIAIRWRESLRPAADWMLAFAALAIVATIAAGFQAYYTVAHDGPSHAAMTTHRNWAVPSGLAILGLAFWRWVKRTAPATSLFKTAFFVAAISLSVTAWWGGHIVYNYGLGVKSLPVVTGDGHDHDHGEADHDTAPMPSQSASNHSAPGEGLTQDQSHDNSDGHHAQEADPEINPPVEGSPESVVAAFGIALRSGDADTLRRLIASDVVIAEGGAAERSFEQYAGHHMISDMAFIGNVTTTLKKRDVIAGDDLATVISQSEITGQFKDKPINSQMMETMVLQRADQGWRIVHIHWSSAALKTGHEH